MVAGQRRMPPLFSAYKMVAGQRCMPPLFSAYKMVASQRRMPPLSSAYKMVAGQRLVPPLFSSMVPSQRCTRTPNLFTNRAYQEGGIRFNLGRNVRIYSWCTPEGLPQVDYLRIAYIVYGLFDSAQSGHNSLKVS